MKGYQFCAIVTGNEPVNYFSRVFPGASSFAPLNPVTRGHMLVIPDPHYERLEEIAGDDLRNVMAAVQIVGDSLGEDYNVIQSNGPAATQTVPHVHFHIVPRREGDGLALPWSGQ